jgi:hypothetical protein
MGLINRLIAKLSGAANTLEHQTPSGHPLLSKSVEAIRPLCHKKKYYTQSGRGWANLSSNCRRWRGAHANREVAPHNYFAPMMSNLSIVLHSGTMVTLVDSKGLVPILRQSLCL